MSAADSAPNGCHNELCSSLRESVARAMCRVDMDEPGMMHVTHYRPMADAALRAIADAGFVIVPREPTEAAVEAAAKSMSEDPKLRRALIIEAGEHEAWAWPISKDIARSALSAALKEMG